MKKKTNMAKMYRSNHYNQKAKIHLILIYQF